MKSDRLWWWSSDFIALIAKRLRFDKLNSVIDFGIGNGHWLHILKPHLSSQTLTYGLDSNLARLKNPINADNIYSPPYCVLGSVQKSPFRDGVFDLATCQTLLIHLSDPQQALDEMVRVVRPGGMILCAEPNNLDNAISWNSVLEVETTENVLILYETWLRLRRGRIARGKGDNNLGSSLPMLLQQANLKKIQVWQTDNPNVVFPPYEHIAKSGLFNDEIQKPEDEEYYQLEFEDFALDLSVGGAGTGFAEIAWDALAGHLKRRKEQMTLNELSVTGTGNLFLAAGIKAE